jgi:hypothetical protein
MIKQPGCSLEQTIVKSVKSGAINEETAAHIDSCGDCREIVKIMRFFQTNLISDAKPKTLPAAGLIWWKSQLRNRQLARERVGQPLFIAQCIGAFFALTILVWLAFRGSTGFPSLDSGLSRVLSSMEQVVFPLAIGLIVLTFTCIILSFTLHRFLIEK